MEVVRARKDNDGEKKVNRKYNCHSFAGGLIETEDVQERQRCQRDVSTVH